VYDFSSKINNNNVLELYASCDVYIDSMNTVVITQYSPRVDWHWQSMLRLQIMKSVVLLRSSAQETLREDVRSSMSLPAVAFVRLYL